MALPGRPPPTTFEHVEVTALRAPQRLALVEGSRSWNYRELYLDLAGVIRVLEAAGVRRGERVAVGMTSFRWSLMLLLAAENLGAATVSFLPTGDPDAAAVFALADWVIADVPQDVAAPARFLRVDDALLRRFEDAGASDPQAVPRIPLALDEPQRITRTSGSTGRSKFMVLLREAQEFWISDVARTSRLAPDSRVVLVGALVLNAHFSRASACLRMGAAVLDVPAAGLAAHDITHLSALPVVLEDLLRELPPGYAPKRPVYVTSNGGTLSKSFRERLARAFGGPVVSRYGMNEAAAVCEVIGADGVGPLAPGADVRILGEDGADLPPGRFGVICVRTPAMAGGYLSDPQASRAAFRDGWFVTGDWGAMVGPRVLRVAGRHDDLVNAGGIKVPAGDIEAQVQSIVNPRDCAVLATHLDGGETTMGIALVMDGPAPRDEVRHKLASGLQLVAGTGARVLFLPAIPRLGNSKVDRMALMRIFESPPPGSV